MSTIAYSRTVDEDFYRPPRFTGVSEEMLAKATRNLVLLVQAHNPEQAKKLQAEITRLDAQEGFDWALAVVSSLPPNHSPKLKLPILQEELQDLRQVLQEWKEFKQKNGL